PRVELAPQLRRVEQLTVVDDAERAVVDRHRLVSELDVDHRQAPAGEANRWDSRIDQDAFRIGPSMRQRLGHRVKPARVYRLPVEATDSRNPAHRCPTFVSYRASVTTVIAQTAYPL